MVPCTNYSAGGVIPDWFDVSPDNESSEMEMEMKSANHFLLLTKVAFTLIVPYPSADCNTIHTFFINFWIFCDRKNLSQTCIYRIAKELQLLYPIKFGNSLYFVVSTLKKAVLAVFLWSVKFFVVKLFGGKHGIALISEAPQRLQFLIFLGTVDISRFIEQCPCLSELHMLFRVGNSKLY